MAVRAFRSDGHRPAYIIIGEDSYGFSILLRIVDQHGEAFNLTGYSAELVARHVGSRDVVLIKTLNVVDAAGGVVEYVPERDDFPGPGLYYGRIALGKADTKIETTDFPIHVF